MALVVKRRREEFQAVALEGVAIGGLEILLTGCQVLLQRIGAGMLRVGGVWTHTVFPTYSVSRFDSWIPTRVTHRT